ncbi:MAG: DinB family protein [Dehalococcoidia bacterium]
MDARQMYLLQHARTYSATMQEGGPHELDLHLRAQPAERHLGDRLEDAALFGLNDEQALIRPKEGQNSIAWLLWHMARSEDVTINALVAGQPQVVDDGWASRLNLSTRDVGAGMADDEVTDFCARINLAELRAYRVVVGQRTREVALSLSPDAWDRPVDPAHLERAFADGVLRDNAAWVKEFWNNRTNAWFFAMISGHNYMHIGEAFCVRSQAGLALGV